MSAARIAFVVGSLALLTVPHRARAQQRPPEASPSRPVETTAPTSPPAPVPAPEPPPVTAAAPQPPAEPPPVDNDPARADFTHDAPGRVPLRVETVGPVQQHVGVTLAIEQRGTGFESRVGMDHRVLCETPCTLHVPPGPFALYTGGRGIVEVTSHLTVPTVAMRARVFAPSRGLDVTATTLASVGAVALVVGVIMLAATFTTAGPPDALEATSIGLAGAGAVMLPVGLVISALNHRGLQYVGP